MAGCVSLNIGLGKSFNHPVPSVSHNSLLMQNPSSPSRRVVVTVIGAVTPCGNTAVDTWSSLIAGRSGIGRVTRFDPTGCAAQIAGEVKNFDPARTLPALL